ncbi:MAG: hypothetical protein VYD57_01420, partial [Pseudomonadota bacterium]|nr:hypothetical protein [Pseudomonadota bacterium]
SCTKRRRRMVQPSDLNSHRRLHGSMAVNQVTSIKGIPAESEIMAASMSDCKGAESRLGWIIPAFPKGSCRAEKRDRFHALAAHEAVNLANVFPDI